MDRRYSTLFKRLSAFLLLLSASVMVGASAAEGQAAPQLTGFTCRSASIGGTGTDLCTVTISAPALASGFRVGVSSNNVAATTPTASFISAKATSAQFTAVVSPVSKAQTVILTASAGSVTKTFTLTLTVPVPTLSVNQSSVSFGNVTVNTPLTETITLTSTGTAPVTISGAAVTGAGFSLTQGSIPPSLNPGQTTTLGVQFDPTAIGAATGQLSISTNSSSGKTTVTSLSGTGIPQLTGISCRVASMGGTGTDLCTVTISGPAPTGGFRVGLASNNAAATVPTASLIAANATSAQFTASISPVSTAQTAILSASAGNITTAFDIALAVPVPALSVSQSSIAFGNVTVNTPLTKTVTLTSTGTAAVLISGAVVTGTGFALNQQTFPILLAPGQSATLGVQFDSAAIGEATGQLTVASNDPANGSRVVSLTAAGTPQLSGISCVSSSMVGAGTDLCTLTISGPAQAGGFRVGLSSNNAAATTPTASLVAANATTSQFTINVSPVTTAQTVSVTATGGTATQVFVLNLNAALPNLNIGPAGIAFGNVALNVPAAWTVTLTSTGAAILTINGAVVTGAGFSLVPVAFPVSLNPGQSIVLNVQFDPATAGAVAGQLTVSSNSATNGASTIPLSGTGATSGTFTYAGSPIISTLVPPNPSAPIAGSFFGLTIHHLGSTPFPAFPVSTLRLWDVAPWSAIESSSGQFDWSKIDNPMVISQANGVSDYLFTFGNVPTWASTDPSGACTNGDGVGSCAPPDMTAFDGFATALVQRYCGTIKYYETWNEANNPSYWSGTNAQLLSVAQDLYQIAKNPANCGCTNGVCAPNGGVNPNQVLSPSISRINGTNLNWLDSYMATAGPTYPYADVIAFHGYDLTSPEDMASEVPLLNQVLTKYDVSSLPTWDTETSWGSLTPVDETQASWLMRYHAVLATTGVSRIVWYAYDDCGWGTLFESTGCNSPQMPTGVVTDPGQAYAVIENWLSGANLASCNQYQNGLWVCELDRPGSYSAWMLWSSTGTSITVPIPEDSGLTLYRDWQNNVNALPAQLTVDQMPVLLGNLNP